MGGATLSKSNFLFMGRAVFPPCHLKTMVEIWKIMVTIRRPCAGTAALSALDPAAAHCQPTAVPETPVHSQASLGQSLVGSLLLSPGSWCTQGFVCALQDSVSPVLCKFYNQIPLASKVKFPGVLSSFARSPGWEICLCPRAFLTVQEIIWYNFSVVCGSSAWWL